MAPHHGDRRGSGNGLGCEFLHVCVHDATGFAYAEVLPDENGDTAAGFMERALAWYQGRHVLVERVVPDNGSCYRSKRFNRVLTERGIRPIQAGPYRPQTNGRADRFIRTVKNEWAHRRPNRTSAARRMMRPAFLSRYSTRRRHRGIGNPPPHARLKALV